MTAFVSFVFAAVAVVAIVVMWRRKPSHTSVMFEAHVNSLPPLRSVPRATPQATRKAERHPTPLVSARAKRK